MASASAGAGSRVAASSKMVCGEGDDCPCYQAEEHRVPKKPTTESIKVS